MIKKLFYVLAAALAFAACSKDKVNPELKLSSESLVFTAEGGTQTVNVTSNVEWTITGDANSWAKLSATSGDGDGSFTVTVPADYGTGRSLQLYVNVTGISLPLAIVQQRTPVPDNPEDVTINLRSFEQDYTVTVPSGYEYNVVLPSGVELVKQEATSFVVHLGANASEAYLNYPINIETTDGKTIKKVTLVQSWRNVEPGEFLIDEIFFAGCLIEGATYSDGTDGDQYFRLYNNTDETLYADGLMITFSKSINQVASTGATTQYPTLTDKIGIGDVYIIPGTGKDVPVEPGKSIVLAFAAQDFSADNAASLDLSVADFEFNDVNDFWPDTDNPDVPDLDIWFKSSASISFMYDTGQRSYTISTHPAGMTAEKFMTDYAWVGTTIFDWNGYHFENEIKDAYLVPNEWIIDGVNLAIPEDLGTLWLNSAIDAGYTNVTTKYRDPERFGKAVIRKDHADTNNSTNDFEVGTPTLKK